ITITQTATVTFTAGAVNAAHSIVSATPTAVVADGTTTSTITVTLKDVNDNPVSGKTVTLAEGTGSSTISAASGASNTSGVVTFTVKDTNGEPVTYPTRRSSDPITITQTATVTFTAGAVNAAHSTMGATPATVVADGRTEERRVGKEKGAEDDPVSGKTETPAEGTGSTTIAAASGASNNRGVGTF